MITKDFSSYQPAIVGTTLEGYQKHGLYNPLNEFTIAPALPQPSTVIYGAGKVKYVEDGMARLSGTGKLKVIPVEALVLAARLSVRDLPEARAPFACPVRSFVADVSRSFADAGVKLLRVNSDIDTDGRRGLVAFYAPLKPEAYSVSSQLAHSLRGPANAAG